MAGLKLLLPYNFSPSDQKAVDFAVRVFSPLTDVTVTLFNAYTPIPDIEASAQSVTGKLKSNLGYLTQKISEQEESLKSVAGDMIWRGFGTERVRYVFRPRKRDVAAEIIDLARNEKFTIVLLNRKPEKISRFFTASVFSKVVAALKNTAVCVVS